MLISTFIVPAFQQSRGLSYHPDFLTTKQHYSKGERGKLQNKAKLAEVFQDFWQALYVCLFQFHVKGEIEKDNTVRIYCPFYDHFTRDDMKMYFPGVKCSDFYKILYSVFSTISCQGY